MDCWVWEEEGVSEELVLGTLTGRETGLMAWLLIKEEHEVVI
jgi:hypothetical protein